MRICIYNYNLLLTRTQQQNEIRKVQDGKIHSPGAGYDKTAIGEYAEDMAGT